MSVPLLRMTSRSVVVAVLAVGLWLGAAGRVRANPLNPLDFASLGAFPTAVGDYTFNTSGTPTLTGPNGTILTGVVSHGIAVFDFDAITIAGPPSGGAIPSQVFTATGSLPLALLSRTNATIAGQIDGSGFSHIVSPPTPPFSSVSPAAPAAAPGASSDPVAAPAAVGGLPPQGWRRRLVFPS